MDTTKTKEFTAKAVGCRNSFTAVLTSRSGDRPEHQIHL